MAQLQGPVLYSALLQAMVLHSTQLQASCSPEAAGPMAEHSGQGTRRAKEGMQLHVAVISHGARWLHLEHASYAGQGA